MRIGIFALVLVAGTLFSSCESQQNLSLPRPKYVFLFIADGMGFAHIAATEAYLAGAGIEFAKFPDKGTVSTHSVNSRIPCSAAAGTALSTGVKTNNNMVGMNPKGEKLKSFTYDLKEAGYKIGIATNVSIDHATPATFFASTSHRENYYEIASQLAPSGFDFFAGSGFLEPTGKDKTKENICNLIRKADYALIRMPEELEQVPASQKIVMVQAETDGIECSRESLVRAIDRTGNDGWTLTDFTKIGIDLLKNSQFFFMIEGGQIDWESHDNNMPAMIQEMIDFSKAVEIALEFYEQYPEETLIIVTSDHETGGLTLNKFEWTGTDHTGEDVPIFAIGAGSELFRGKNDNTDVAKNIKRLTVRN